MIKMAPSILSADLLDLRGQVGKIAENGADYIHVDVMDGHFVPNLTFGPNMVAAMKKLTKVPLDVHLMITNAELYIEEYAKAGADVLTIHAEAATHMHRAIQQIHANGMKAGVSLNPATPVSVLEDIFEDLDLVLIMTVNPGFGGQKFIHRGLDKIAAVKKMMDQRNKPDLLLEVDGGVNTETAPLVAKAGANLLVAGSAVFNAPDSVAAMEAIRKAAEAAL